MRKSMLLAAMLSLTVLMFVASPAMAQDWDDWINGWNYNADSEWYDELCSPGLPDGIYVPGCIFSDADDHDDDFWFDDHHDWDWDHDWDRKDWDRKDWDRKDWD